jgi:hypothetical protein
MFLDFFIVLAEIIGAMLTIPLLQQYGNKMIISFLAAATSKNTHNLTGAIHLTK